jgi:hypothetical protein
MCQLSRQKGKILTTLENLPVLEWISAQSDLTVLLQVRCEGSQPICKTCEAYNDTCRYDKAPPLSAIVSMAKRLQEAESVLERLQSGQEETSVQLSPRRDSQNEPLPTTVSSSEGRHEADRDRRNGADSIAGPEQVNSFEQPRDTDMFIFAPEIHDRRSSGIAQPVLPLTKHCEPSVMQQGQAAIDLSLDQNGELCYYGPTSALHDPPELDAPSPRSSAYGSGSTNDVREYLLSHAKESSIWEQFALGNAARQTGMPEKVMTKLLQLHFTWVAPMFMWVYRPALMRE